MSNVFFLLLFFKKNIYYGWTVADEALYYSTIYPNSRDLGTAHASLAFAQLRT